jgi:hypothetical protein
MFRTVNWRSSPVRVSHVMESPAGPYQRGPGRSEHRYSSLRDIRITRADQRQGLNLAGRIVTEFDFAARAYRMLEAVVCARARVLP